MRNKTIWLLAVLIVIVGIFYFVDKGKNTTVQKEVFAGIGEMDAVGMSLERYSDETRISIKDKETVAKMVEGLSGVKLKKVSDFSSESEYAIRIYSDHAGNLGLEMTKDKKYVAIFKDSGHIKYKIVNDDHHLDMIDSLDWEQKDFEN
ncbi:hypothetical protein [Paenibacillus sp. FJAT-27812]|uniref:hypothetical protein n=1 Tax=Paenibacillus sp. FJAT-27812 TaxID=1684143 RepID=UPI0006A7846A|nr:hypothetical protein [Paenibacillus sp. FJAT-27812]